MKNDWAKDEVTETFSLRQSVLNILEKSKPNGLTVQEMMLMFGSRSHAFLILFFCLPFIQPLPMFGLSTPLGFAISVIGIFMALDKKPFLPKYFRKKQISFLLIESCCNTLSKILSKTEKLIKPRYEFWVSWRITKIFDGFLIAIFGLLLSLPIPIPFSNSIPAYFLILNAIGWLERDGLILILSYGVAILGLIFFASIGGIIFESIYLLADKMGLYTIPVN